ncbi:chemotaxis protein CheB [Streptomyces sp. SID14478]|nr:chemotaxis protein CheB [Streptomyces sp. SID14478]NEB78660.1 chemotaxis protein CheB [Streptomyces sp. SID14478]
MVVAASAGGVQGLRTLLGGLDPELPVTVLVAQHLRRGRETQIVPVLSRATSLEVKLAQDGERPRPGVVHIAPPDRHLCVRAAGRQLALTAEQRVHRVRPAADPLFESAAEAFGPDTIACVLTGADGDGAQGVTAVKRHGGVVLVQDPDTARFRGMPQAAIDTGLVDSVLPLEHIAPAIERIVARY